MTRFSLVPKFDKFRIDFGITFKHAKDALKNRSWRPQSVEDADHLYWLDGKTYRKLDDLAWGQIETAKAKL